MASCLPRETQCFGDSDRAREGEIAAEEEEGRRRRTKGGGPRAFGINRQPRGCENQQPHYKKNFRMSKAPTIRPDFDTDVLWKPTRRMSNRDRTTSTDSNDSELGRKISDIPMQSGSSPVDAQPRTRRLSFTEMIFGSPTGGFSWGQATAQQTAVPDGQGGRKASITEDARFKELMKHQNKILGDGWSSGFHFSF